MAYRTPFSEPPRILVVDKNESVRNSVFTVLFWSGYEVDGVSAINEAWDALNTAKYDLLIVENALPDLSGFEMLRKLRSKRSKLPVIIATNPSDREAVTPFQMHLPTATIIRPYSENYFLDTVNDAIHSAGW